MPKNVKHYILTAVILGSIAMVGGALIGVANLITKDKIAKNEENKINVGIADLFGENTTRSEQINIIGNDKYLDYYYKVNANDALVGYAFRVTGRNAYGKISMLVGINTSYNVGRIYLITNEQTYAQTLVDNYVTPYNNGTTSLDDVYCGATYGAKLVRDMANEAATWANSNLKGGNA
ncbi:MAG: hypothetical protein K6F07_00960 [Bacilli bacterium]|nr:hypothetical protein [Bacilli bacterium]